MNDTNNGKPDDPVLAAAMAYIEKDWAVFPLHRRILGEDGKSHCSCGNPNCRAKGKEPLTPHGYKDATTDEEAIRAFLRKYPRCNLGIATGEASGLLVFDIDGPEGRKNLLALEERYGVLPATLTSATGRTDGGEHRFFRYPKGSGIGCPTKVAPGIHVKGIGGYVVAPPSVHESGNVYAWRDDTVEIAELPQAWVDLLVGAQGQKGTNTTIGKARKETMNAEEGKTREGNRNNRLHEIACSLVHKGLPKNTVLASIQALNEAECDPPLGEAEVQEIVESAWKYRNQEKPETGSQRQLRLKLTDEGNAQRLNSSKGDQLLWDTEQKRFRVYDGKVWISDDGDLAQTLARDVVNRLEEEAQSLEDPRDRAAMTEFAAKCQTPTRIKAALELYRMDKDKFVTQDDFDTQPHLLNCLNGTVDLKTGRLLPHDPSLRQTFLAPVIYQPGAKSPLWLDFLKKVFRGNPDAIKSFRLQLGYFVTGEMGEQKFFVWLGTNARNGKSTIRKALGMILGEYVGDCSSSAFTAKRFGSSEAYELGNQAGKRMVFSAEIADTHQLDEPLLKAITGGDRHTFREIYGKPVRTYPKFKIVIPCNRLPEIRGQDDGMWDRCFILNFNHKFEGSERIPDYHQVLLKEKEGILAWLVEAAAEWYQEGLFCSKESALLGASYRTDSDPIALFVEECCLLDPQSSLRASDLFNAYSEWAGKNREPGYSRQKFGREFPAKYSGKVSKKNDIRGNYYSGIGFKVPEPAFMPIPDQPSAACTDAYPLPYLLTPGSDDMNDMNDSFI